MSAVQFTPGPWTFDGPPSSRIVWAGDDRRICFLTSDGPNKANARLIAAAPDLYAVVAEWQDYLFGDGDASAVRECRIHNAMREALAKARGETL